MRPRGGWLPASRSKAGVALPAAAQPLAGSGPVTARAAVKSALHPQQLGAEESRGLAAQHQYQLQFSPKQSGRRGGKRYLALIGVEDAPATPFFAIDRSCYGHMDHGLPAGDIADVRR